MSEILGASSETRTLRFPMTVRTVRQGTFHKNGALRSAVLNEGLEALGTDEYKWNGDMCDGSFQESGLRSVKLPSTLKRIWHCAFMKCAYLKSVELPEGLERIENGCFA